MEEGKGWAVPPTLCPRYSEPLVCWSCRFNKAFFLYPFFSFSDDEAPPQLEGPAEQISHQYPEQVSSGAKSETYPPLVHPAIWQDVSPVSPRAVTNGRHHPRLAILMDKFKWLTDTEEGLLQSINEQNFNSEWRERKQTGTGDTWADEKFIQPKTNKLSFEENGESPFLDKKVAVSFLSKKPFPQRGHRHKTV